MRIVNVAGVAIFALGGRFRVRTRNPYLPIHLVTRRIERPQKMCQLFNTYFSTAAVNRFFHVECTYTQKRRQLKYVL